MRSIWFDRLVEMLKEIDDSPLLDWDRADIERLFNVKRSCALVIMRAIDSMGISESPPNQDLSAKEILRVSDHSRYCHH